MGFAENMKAIADELVRCGQERTAAVAEITVNTHRFLGQVAQEHKERAEHVNIILADNRRERQDQVRALMTSFHEVQVALGQEVQEAKRVWRSRGRS